MTTNFADLSHHQTAVDLTAYARAGHDRVMLKATEGVGFLDGTFVTRWRQAAAAGLHRGAYHFLRNDFDGPPQWAWFAKCVASAGGLRPGDWLCVDVEDTNTTAGAADCARAFTAAAAATAGARDGHVYTGKWYADPNGITAAVFPPGWRRLWLSDYTPGQPDGAIEVPAGWARTQVAARQYTDKATVAGVGGSCDYNRVLDDWLPTEDDMPLTDADVDKLWAEPQPWPEGFDDVGPGGTTFKLRDYVSGARVEAGRAARQATAANAAVKTLQAAVTAQGRQLTAVAAAVAALGDDEAKTLAALGGAEQRILGAVRAVLGDPAVDNDDPDAVIAALRDTLVRGTAKPAEGGEA